MQRSQRPRAAQYDFTRDYRSITQLPPLLYPFIERRRSLFQDITSQLSASVSNLVLYFSFTIITVPRARQPSRLVCKAKHQNPIRETGGASSARNNACGSLWSTSTMSSSRHDEQALKARAADAVVGDIVHIEEESCVMNQRRHVWARRKFRRLLCLWQTRTTAYAKSLASCQARIRVWRRVGCSGRDGSGRDEANRWVWMPTATLDAGVKGQGLESQAK